MLRSVLARIQQKHRTTRFPKAEPEMPERFRGAPLIERDKCPSECAACTQACPTSALVRESGGMRLDLGRCLFCTDCRDACSAEAVRFDRRYSLATREREELVYDPASAASDPAAAIRAAEALGAELRRVMGRSFKVRQVSAGGCNACEADFNVLGTIGWDIGRFGIQVVASPRHADGILVTGPVSKNMELALRKTYEAVPSPRVVIAVGACAISGGPFADHQETCGGAGAIVPVDLFIPGCPPHPVTILDGLLRLLGRRK